MDKMELSEEYSTLSLNDIEIIQAVKDGLARAEKLHPVFAEGLFHALGFLSEEHGEVTKEITKHKPGWEERMDEELLDLIAVALRMLNREYGV